MGERSSMRCASSSARKLTSSSLGLGDSKVGVEREWQGGKRWHGSTNNHNSRAMPIPVCAHLQAPFTCSFGRPSVEKTSQSMANFLGK